MQLRIRASASELNDYRAFDSSTVGESAVKELDLSEVRVEEDHCLNEESLRLEFV